MFSYRKYVDSMASRSGEILGGVALGLFGLLFAALAAFGGYRMLQDRNFEPAGAVFVGILLLLAAGIAITAVRLISGKGRKADGGLFPPWFLRMFGLIFLAAAIVIPIVDAEHRLPMFGALTLGAGCLYLANRQERAAQALRVPGNDT